MRTQGLFTLTLFTVLGFVLSNPACPPLKDGMVNVHLVCHTHDDVGWLKTVDQYYYGSNKGITWVGVQYIIDSVIASLNRNPSRKFIYVESAFFYRWWNQQDDDTKSNVQALVESGQLEFTNGGWVMNDEAATHYNEIIDQMTLGVSNLNQTFGPISIPRIAWQIDPFGHSKEQASLFAQMGMDGLFFSRIDHDDKDNRWDNKRMEMVWKASNSLGEDAWIFTGVLPHHYDAPSGFCFDLLCNDEPIMDDPRLEEYNKDSKVDSFLAAVEDQHGPFLSSNVIMTMGSDFHYVYAEAWYKNLDKLIKYVNERQVNGSNVNVFYSTPSCYLDALHAANLTWPTKTDDFFPYSSDPHAYWTGYFTSRPTLKGFIRKSNNVLQVAKQISALAGIPRESRMVTLAESIAVCTHHDAATGTAKQHVTDDYSKMLATGEALAADLIADGLRILTQSDEPSVKASEFEYCPLLNISSCPPVESATSFVVNVYNPIARNINYYVRIPVAAALTYTVTDELGTSLETQIVPLPSQVVNLPGRTSAALYELIFYVPDLPALGNAQFLVESSPAHQPRIKKLGLSPNVDTTYQKGRLSVTLDAKTQKLKAVGAIGKEGFVEMNMTQNWMWYVGMPGNNQGSEDRASGAYIFRPDGEANEFTLEANTTSVFDGPLVNEIQQSLNPWVSHVLRTYRDRSYIEIEWLVGPIPVDDDVGKEIVNRVLWDEMTTNNTFYTDANGRELQKRVKDYRETWTLASSEPVSQNYYPVNSKLILSSTNGKGQAAILNDRAQGGTSLSDGAMELMVHRRLLHDDAFGVGEALDETAYGTGLVARGRHILVHSDFATTECDFGCQHRTISEEILLQPVLTFSAPTLFKLKAKTSLQRSGLTAPLPPNLRLLTLEPWFDGKWLLRLENFFEAGESSISGTVDFDIREMFSNWSIVDVAEVTLAGNQLKADNHRLVWQTENDSPKMRASNEKDVPSPSYSFLPMQIRTFIVEVVVK